jgi:hypothetical protein
MKVIHFRYLGVSGFVTLLLAACGGGGGSDSEVVVPPPVAVVITANNYAVVSSDSLNAAAFGGELGDLTGTGILGGPASPGMMSKLDRLPGVGMGKVYGQVSEATIGPITEDCIIGGTVTLTVTVADPNTVTAGDSISMSFSMCDDGDGQVLDGDMDMVFTGFSGDLNSGLYLISVSVTLGSLSMDDGGLAAVVDGAFDMTTDTRAYPVTTSTVSGDLLTLQAEGRSLTMKTFSTTTVFDGGAMSFSVTAEGIVASSRFDGEAAYETIVPFTGNTGNPYEGELLITGADGATITVIALDEVNVRLIMDYDGDGAEDDSIDLTWEEAVG